MLKTSPHHDLALTLPGVDASTLIELSDAPQVRAWTQRKLEEYKTHISTLLAIHNSVAPINTLPTEIFQKVFADVPSVSTWCDARWMLSLGSVCRRWRSVLLATPEYWARGLHAVTNPYYLQRFRSSDGEDENVAHGRTIFLGLSSPWPLEITMNYSSLKTGPGWGAFEDHFNRVTVFEVAARDPDDLDGILNAVTSNMKRLERLRLDVSYSMFRAPRLLFDWQAEYLPRLGHLEISSPLFSSTTTVPSLHTVILTRPPRDIISLPPLLDALEKCPALTTLRLEIMYSKDDELQNWPLKRVVNLPCLRNLVIRGGISAVRYLLSGLSFPGPEATFVQLNLMMFYEVSQRDRWLALLEVLPRRHSTFHAHQMLDGIDRLYFHSRRPRPLQNGPTMMSMRGYVQGAVRLYVIPALRLDRGGDLLQTIALFQGCRVSELALDLRDVPDDMDGEFWTEFFAALPDLSRLELLSPTIESDAIKHDIATHYLASRCEVQSTPSTTLRRRAMTLAWVLRVDRYDTSKLEADLRAVQQVLDGHAEAGGRLDRLELYFVTSEPDYSGPEPTDVTQVKTDRRVSRLVAEEFSHLEAVAEVVVVGGGWESVEDNETGLDDIDEEEED